MVTRKATALPNMQEGRAQSEGLPDATKDVNRKDGGKEVKMENK